MLLQLVYSSDGKKLSNKERKRILKERQAMERQAYFEKSASKASKEGAQFVCSQTTINEDDPLWQNSLDVNVPSFSISAAGFAMQKVSWLSDLDTSYLLYLSLHTPCIMYGED